MSQKPVLIAAATLGVLWATADFAAPCRLDANDRPINCPPSPSARTRTIHPVKSRSAHGATRSEPLSAPTGSGQAACLNPKNKMPIKCPPVMLAPMRDEAPG